MHGTAPISTEHAHRGDNVCVASCLFCSFAKLKRVRPAPHHEVEERGELECAWTIAQRDHNRERLHPGCPSVLRELLRGFKRIKPDIHMKCFTAVEIHFFAQH